MDFAVEAGTTQRVVACNDAPNAPPRKKKDSTTHSLNRRLLSIDKLAVTSRPHDHPCLVAGGSASVHSLR